MFVSLLSLNGANGNQLKSKKIIQTSSHSIKSKLYAPFWESNFPIGLGYYITLQFMDGLGIYFDNIVCAMFQNAKFLCFSC